MSTFKIPADDAPAAEWGAFAKRIPGWRNPETLRVGPQGQQMPWTPFLLEPRGVARVPDPDHWVWEGWLLRMLGGNTQVQVKYWLRRKSWEVCANAPDSGAPRWGDGSTLGRAAIAAAAAIGRWPGGGE